MNSSGIDGKIIDLGNSMFSSNTCQTGMTQTQALSSMMENTQNKQLLVMKNSYEEPKFTDKFVKSFQFIEKLDQREIHQRIYSRDGSILANDIPFCLKQ